MYHCRWCKNIVLALRQGLPVKPYCVFMSGPGGVGKSHVIRLIHSDTLRLLRLSGTMEPDDITVLLTAPTGVAVFNINGITLHAALLLGCSKCGGFQPLSHNRLNTLRSKLSWLMLVIIDEVSTVVSDGLVNGARGEVVHFVTSTDNKVTRVLVKFDNPNVGLNAMQSSLCPTHCNAVALNKHQTIFLAHSKKGSEVTRLQFPLTLAWATTIHKVQGLTLDEIVVDMKGGHFSPGQAYVAFSRVILVYRSPSSPMDIFTNLLTTLLQNQSFLTVATVIMGDFNDDMFNRLDSRIYNLMSTNKFKQLVSKPTTDRGTLIDHIYNNKIFYKIKTCRDAAIKTKKNKSMIGMTIVFYHHYT